MNSQNLLLLNIYGIFFIVEVTNLQVPSDAMRTKGKTMPANSGNHKTGKKEQKDEEQKASLFLKRDYSQYRNVKDKFIQISVRGQLMTLEQKFDVLTLGDL